MRTSLSAGLCLSSACTVGRTSTSPPPSRHSWRYGDDFEVANRPAAGVATRRPEEPYTNSVRTVLWEPGRGNRPGYPRVRGRRRHEEDRRDRRAVYRHLRLDAGRSVGRVVGRVVGRAVGRGPRALEGRKRRNEKWEDRPEFVQGPGPMTHPRQPRTRTISHTLPRGRGVREFDPALSRTISHTRPRGRGVREFIRL